MDASSDVAVGPKRVQEARSTLHRIRRFFERQFPGLYAGMRAGWYKRNLYQMLRVIAAENGLIIRGGPFQGVQYPSDLLTSEAVLQYALLPKILGCYEAELHAVVLQIVERDYDRFVNIGCAEGYYSVGLALRLPRAHVFAFDTDPVARKLCQQMAVLNGVADRITIASQCKTEHLQTLAKGRACMVCDCEGCELGLLQPELVPGLSGCDLIVELHDCPDRRISDEVPARFASTHHVSLIKGTDRDLSAYPLLARFSPRRRRLAVGEYRWGAPPVWAFMTSRHREQP
jgi:hypothetical protein